MQCVTGIDLGSTTTKAVLLDLEGRVVGQGITNSRSNYEVACAVARQEALIAARFSLIQRELDAHQTGSQAEALMRAFRLELYLDQLRELAGRVLELLDHGPLAGHRATLGPPARTVLDRCRADAPALFAPGAPRKSDFFRDLAGAAFMAASQEQAAGQPLLLERLLGLFDRAILDVETRLTGGDFEGLLRRALDRLPHAGEYLRSAARRAGGEAIVELAFSGTGYGRQTLPFPKETVRSEILCHGRGAHRIFPGTRTVLDIGGQDTKAIQVDEQGVVTGFQMNDRCAAGCGRYLGYIADELNLGLHELGPLALKARRAVKVNSTCTVFAGAELRERLALGEAREDILAGLHRAIMLRALSLLARSGGIRDQFSFTGGVCKNPMATRVLGELVREHYGEGIALNTHADSIYMGALGAALFALDDVRAGRPAASPDIFVRATNSILSGRVPLRTQREVAPPPVESAALPRSRGSRSAAS